MVSLIIPAFNERELIGSTVRRAARFLERLTDGFEIIVADDGSGDGTFDEAAAAGAVVTRSSENRGKGAAVRAGASLAQGEYLFFTDADLPYSLDFITRGAALLKNCDMVRGNRYGDYPLKRKIASALYNRAAGAILGMELRDAQCGIKGFTRRAAERIFPLCAVDGFAFDTEVLFLAHRLALDVRQIDVAVSHRGASRVRLRRDGVQMLADVLKIRDGYRAGEYRLYERLYGRY
ncbi:MAG: glycosyltransferase [Clostridiales bacterium]|jgi:dolichyl-phosphate beta-glucosyltransferase|nr:glycosyltransferase [Clostridiales bacterium]